MKRRKRVAYSAVCGALLVIIGVAAWQIAAILGEYREGRQTYALLAEATECAPRPSSPQADASLETVRDFAALWELAPDAVGWLSIPGTMMEYPVVQGTDNEYYLTHLATGENNPSGAIFLDYRSAADFSDPCSIVYGHNMLDGSMFSDLMKYEAQPFFDAHPEGVLETPEGSRTVRFFAGFVADGDSEVWQRDRAAEDLPAWASRLAEQSCFASGLLPSRGDRVIVLATCNADGSARFVLIGVLE